MNKWLQAKGCKQESQIKKTVGVSFSDMSGLFIVYIFAGCGAAIAMHWVRVITNGDESTNEKRDPKTDNPVFSDDESKAGGMLKNSNRTKSQNLD